MNSETLEMTKVFNLLIYITDHFHAEGDAEFNWSERRIEITVDEGGKTVYAAAVMFRTDDIEAKCRLIRHELESMVRGALIGRMEQVA